MNRIVAGPARVLGAMLLAAALGLPATTPARATNATLDSVAVRLRLIGPLRGQGQYAAADSIASALLGEVRAAGAADSSIAADVLEQWVLTRILWSRFRDDTVLAAARRSVEIRRRVSGALSLESAASLNVLGRLFSYLNRFAASESSYREALVIQERLAGSDSPAVGATLNNLANLHIYSGDLKGAAAEYRRALDIARHRIPRDERQVGLLENNLANALSNLGEHSTARDLYEDAVRLGEQEDELELARRLYNYGRFLTGLGEADSARAILERSLRLRERRLGPDNMLVGQTLWRLGGIRHMAGDLDEAERLYRRAAVIIARDPRNVREQAYVVQALASVATTRGDLAQGEMLFDSTARLMRRVFGPDQLPVLTPSYEIAAIRLRRGDARGALAGYRRCWESYLRSGAPWETGLATQLGIAWANVALGNYDEAATSAIEGASQGANIMRSVGAGFGEQRGLETARGWHAQSDLAISGAVRVRRPELAGGAFQCSAEGRGQVIDAVRARYRVWAESPDSTVRELWHDLAAASRRLANLTFAGEGAPDAAAIRAARAERDRLDEALARRSADYDRQRGAARVSCGALAAALPAGSALISYFRYGDYTPADTTDPATKHGPAWAWPRRHMAYAAFVMHAGDSSVAAFPLGDAAPLDSLVAGWRERVIASAGRAGEAAARRWGAAVRERMWDPVAGAVAGAGLVLVVPDGSLNLVNIGALPDSAGYLIERGPLVHVLATERDLFDPPLAGAGEGGGLLALGGVDFSARLAGRTGAQGGAYRGPHSACADLRGLAFDPLPASLREVRDVRSIWLASRGGTAPEPAAQLLTGARATEEAAKREMPHRAIVHLATHGFALAGDCGSTAPGQRGIGGLQAAPVDSGAYSEIASEPLLLSGLALAGANRRDAVPPGADDGILTAEEIAVLDLRDVRWAVLSGCDTGGGGIRDGEGVFGLRRAFRIAGARTLIMSLWPVEDEAAGAWMRELYRARLERGRSTPEAMREASLEILRDLRRHGRNTSPFTWGAFVAAGDWR